MNKSFLLKWYQPFIGYNRNIRLFFIANGLFQLGVGIYMVMYNLYIKSLGYPEQINGSIISMTALASAIILIPAGVLSDKIGRKKIIFIGLIFSSSSFFIRAIAEGKSILIMFAFFSGIFMAFIQVSIVPFLAENSTKEQRVTLFSYNAALMMIANMLGNVIGGSLADFLEWAFQINEVNSLKLTLLFGSIIQFLAIIPLLKINEPKKQIHVVKSKLSELVIQNKHQILIILKFTLASMIIGFGSGLVIPYLNLYFKDRFEVGNTTIGFVVAFGQMATAIAMVIGPSMVKKIGEVRSVVFLQLSSIPFLLLTGYTNIFILATFGFLFRQALMNAGNPIQQSLIMEQIDDKMKGLANSLQAMVFNLGWALMGPISTNIVAKGGSYYGYAIVFSITGTLYVIGSIYFYFVFGRKSLNR